MVLIFSSCEKTNEEKIFTISIENKNFLELNLIDSLVENKVFELRSNMINAYSNKYLIDYASRIKNQSTDEYILENIEKKAINLLNDSVLLKNDSAYYKKRLLQIKLSLQSKLIDSLKIVFQYQTKLIPNYTRKINIEKVEYFILNKINSKPKLLVYIISDFNCITCEKTDSKLKYIIDNNNDVEFRFVYFSEYTDPKLYYLCTELNKKGKFRDEKANLYLNENLQNQKKFNLFLLENKIKFNQNEFNISTSSLMKNKKILGGKIYSTPTFVINNEVYDHNNAIEFLQELIKIKKE
tara:strand:- start:2837 stop:3724 length:888 start_codon:yes stop_codon:yes gene_type:complete